MALRIPKPASSGLFKDGYKMAQGVEEAVIKNITAIKELSQITQTSFGPNGRNKIVVNSLEKLFVTNDAATMIREIEVVHPAAKVVVMASQQQESELGDATNLVIVLAAQLLAKAEELLKMGLHPSEVLQGYEIALKKALEILETLPVETVENIKESEAVLKAITTSVGSKLNGYEDFIGNLIHEAALEVMPKTVKNFNVDSVRVVKILGGNISESRVVKGMVLGREPESLATRVEKAKVAIFSCPLDTSATETKGTVLIHNAKEMMDFTKGEEKQVEQIFKELSDAGVKVLVTGGTVGELALHYINRFGMMAIKVQSKFDLRRLCQVVDGTALARLGVPMAEEMGYCEVVESIEIGSDRVTVFRQEQERTKTITVLLRGATRNFLDDVERAIDDGVNTVKALTKDGRLLAGAGASEMQLSKQLHNFGQKTPGIHQHAIKKFAEALEIVPRILGETSGMNSIEILSKIHAAHYSSETVSHQGINIESESASILDAVENGILDSYAVKKNAIELATNSALTVLQVDQIIMSKPAGGPKMPKNNPNWDED